MEVTCAERRSKDKNWERYYYYLLLLVLLLKEVDNEKPEESN